MKFNSMLVWGSLALSLLATQGLAAESAPTGETAKFAALFKQRFAHDYEANRCGANVMKFLKTAKVAGIDANRAQIIELTNAGNSVFGMVNAESVRGGYHFGTGKQFAPEEQNWDFHSFIVMDCWVFDMSFMNEPTVLPLGQYVERMFLDEDKEKDEFFVGRDRKLSEYKVQAFRASSYYAGESSPKPELSFALKDLVQRCQH